MKKLMWIILSISSFGIVQTCQSSEKVLTPEQLFNVNFKNERLEIVKKFLDLNEGFECIVDSSTGNNLLQVALHKKPTNLKFIELLCKYTDFHHKNKKNETAGDTMRKLYAQQLLDQSAVTLVEKYEGYVLMLLALFNRKPKVPACKP